MSPIDQKTRPLKENHLIQRVLHRPVELAGILGTWLAEINLSKPTVGSIPF